MKLPLALAALGAVAILWSIFRQRADPQPADGDRMRVGEFEVVSASVSDARAKRTMPSSGREDASHLLVLPDLPAEETPEEPMDFGPKSNAEWIIDIEVAPGTTVTTDEVKAAFGKPFYAKVDGAMFYGLPSDGGAWTYLMAGDAPTVWTKLAVATELTATYREDPEPVSEKSLADFRAAVEHHAEKLSPKAVTPRTAAIEAVELSSRYFDIWKSADYHVGVALVAPGAAPFEGREVWDVLYSLGLRWGDMDLFHWPNSSADGDDQFFSVWTSSPPGYFLPEELRTGRFRCADLVFGFSVPRSAAPAHVLEQMSKAARYAQKRLGGTLLSADGVPFDEQVEAAAIDATVAKLASAGLEPGRNLTLRLF